jgi:DNA-binding winged helix-turn-helix (wHTH) protein
MNTSLFEPPRSFGPYRLVPGERCLYRDNRPVRLGSRALEILVALMERPGELLSKSELLARVWPNVHIDEGALRVHIAALRKALGKNPSGGQYIANDTGRGYRFSGQLVDASDRTDASAGGNPLDGLPAPAGQIFGREAITQNLVRGLSQRRLFTITGPGGIGKTTVALAVASQLAATYPDGVRFVDLSSLSDPALVSGKVASALQLQVLTRDPLLDVVASLRNRQMLLVLDNCEHLIEALAVLVEHVLAGAPGVNVLTTSREPLRAFGEWVHRLPPLDLPPNSPALDATGVMNSPAACLFVERARAANDALVLSNADTLSIAEICHRVDGIPLAIEFAAALVEVFGVQGVASQLRNSFALQQSAHGLAAPPDPAGHPRVELPTAYPRRTDGVPASFGFRRRVHARGRMRGGSGQQPGGCRGQRRRFGQEVAGQRGCGRSDGRLPLARDHAGLCAGQTRGERRG